MVGRSPRRRREHRRAGMRCTSTGVPVLLVAVELYSRAAFLVFFPPPPSSPLTPTHTRAHACAHRLHRLIGLRPLESKTLQTRMRARVLRFTPILVLYPLVNSTRKLPPWVSTWILRGCACAKNAGPSIHHRHHLQRLAPAHTPIPHQLSNRKKHIYSSTHACSQLEDDCLSTTPRASKNSPSPPPSPPPS